MEAKRVELLQRMPVFGALNERALHLLVEHARRTEVPEGEHFFREGDAARSLFVIESGRAVVVRHWQGREIELNRFGPGDCFGEMALMDLHPRSAAVRALEACTAIAFGPDEMLHLYEADLEQFTLLQMNLGRELCRRLRATDELLFRAAMGEMPPAPQALR
ncbi:MAG: cyclic nucleotide-binding domain-containing protein [Rubrivivax sp.]|nr:cyclic nucleotide-binding domain-containing protein [Rubrivivax sp.]